MKSINNIILITFVILLLGFICFVPIQSRYKINKADEINQIAYITYSSIIPIVNIDTVVNMPKYFYSKVLYNYYKTKDGNIEYYTAVQLNKEIYTYKDRNAYHYVKEFQVGDSVKLVEVFWPSHYIKTLLFEFYDK